MNLKEKWNKQNNSIKLLLKKLKRHDTVVVAIAVVIATALCGGLIYLSTPVVTATAKEEIIQDELVNNEKTVEKLDELREYLDGIDKTVAENQKSLNTYNEKHSENSKETTELTKNMTNNVTEKVVGLDKDMKELRQLINSTIATIDNLKSSMEKGDSDSIQKLGDSFRNLYVQLENIENRYNQTQEKNTELMNDIRGIINGGNKNLTKELQDRYNELLAKLTETDARLIQQNNTSITEYKKEIGSLSNEIDKKLAKLESAMGSGFGEVRTDISGVKGDINSGINGVKNDIGTVNSEINEVKGDINSGIDGINGNISSGLSGVKNDISIVNNGIFGAKNDISTKIDDSISEVNRNIDSKFGDAAGNLQVDLDVLKSYISDEVRGVNRNLDKVFRFVSDGKQLLASALLTKGVKVREGATFSEIANAIISIKTEYVLDPGSIPGKVTYTYHYHHDGNQLECDDGMVDESRHGGCYNKAITHVHSDECYEVKLKYTYTTSEGFEFISDAHGEFDAQGRPFNWYYCPHCKKKFKGTNPSHYESTDSLKVLSKRKGQLRKTTEEKTKICSYEEGDLEGYVTDCGYVFGQVMGADISFPGKYSEYDTTTENGKGSESKLLGAGAEDASKAKTVGEGIIFEGTDDEVAVEEAIPEQDGSDREPAESKEDKTLPSAGDNAQRKERSTSAGDNAEGKEQSTPAGDNTQGKEMSTPSDNTAPGKENDAIPEVSAEPEEEENKGLVQ